MASFFCQLNKKENTHCIYVNIKLPDNLAISFQAQIKTLVVAQSRT